MVIGGWGGWTYSRGGDYLIFDLPDGRAYCKEGAYSMIYGIYPIFKIIAIAKISSSVYLFLLCSYFLPILSIDVLIKLFL